MEQERKLHQLPLEGVQQHLTDARDRLRTDPTNRSVQEAFVAIYKQVDQELDTPQRQRQLIDYAKAKYQTALPEVVEGKRGKMEEIERIQDLLNSKGLNERERQQLEMIQGQLLEPKADLLNERALSVLATLPTEVLQAEYQKIHEDQAERQRKERRNTSRVVELTLIVHDMIEPFTPPVDWESVTMHLVENDAVLEATLYERYAGDIFKLWSEDENLTPRFQAAIDALRFKLRDKKPLTREEETLINDLRDVFNVSSDSIDVAFDRLLDEKDGLLRKWRDREIVRVEQEFSIDALPSIDLDELAERVHTENAESLRRESRVDEQVEREIQAAQQAEHEISSISTEEEFGSSGIRRLEKDTIVETTARDVVRVIEQVFPEYIKSDGGISQDALMKRTVNLPREYHFNVNDVARYIGKRRVSIEAGKRQFTVEDTIRLLASQLNNSAIEDSVIDRAVVEVQRKQLDYRIPALIRKIGNIMTGGTIEADTTGINWEAVNKAKGLDRLSGLMDALSSGAFSASQLQRFAELKSGEFRDLNKERINSLQRVPNNIVVLLNYIYGAMYQPLSSQVKADFDKFAAKKVREMAHALEGEVRSQKRNLQQEITSARTRMNTRRPSKS